MTGQQKYPDGDCRRQGPGYRSHQRSSRSRDELRLFMNEEARKAGFRSLGQMLRAQKLIGETSPKHYWRTAQYKGHTRAREAKRLAERAERQAANG